MSKKKTYLYYATEENCFECDKFETASPIEDVKQFLKDDYLQTDYIESVAPEMESDFKKHGFAILNTVQGQGYDIIIGIAEQGKCNIVRRRINDARREAVAMCGW